MFLGRGVRTISYGDVHPPKTYNTDTWHKVFYG